MAGLEGLASMIYHEKQQSGSMLCAQHAVNSLLQGNYFTAPDLSEIARSLDHLEGSYDVDRGEASTNMDDTGFFSVQVLENALTVWGLGLVRWRSEAMRAYQDRPQVQLGFILNLEQHWYSLRRFGPAMPNVDEDPGQGHWFNLNSFLSAPEWVSKTYLGMVLQQAEAEGYSVFVVTQSDPTGPLALPRVLADEVAATLPEPTSSGTNSSARTRRTMSTSNAPSAQSANADDFGDEDYELQAALQASLMAQQTGDTTDDDEEIDETLAGPLPQAQLPTSISSHSWAQAARSSAPVDHDEVQELDPIAASMERQRRHLERMRAQQEHAQRELWSENDLTPEEQVALQQRRERRRREEEEEEEEMRRAIAASLADDDTPSSSSNPPHKRARMDEAPGVINVDDDDESDVEMASAAHISPPVTANQTQFSGFNDARVYDDEDAELQAALKASMENIPSGWKEPAEPTYMPPQHTTTSASGSQQTTKSMLHPIAKEDSTDSVVSASTENTEKDLERVATPEPLSLDEIRRRRLAKFGL